MTKVDAPGADAWLGTADFLARMPRVGSREGLSLLRGKGMPSRKGKKGFEYPWPSAGEWYLQYIETVARGERPADFEEARARKTNAEAELAEIELAKARGEVVSVSEVAVEVDRLLDRLRAAILAARGKWAPQLLGVEDMAGAAVLLERLTTELLQTLSVIDDDSDDS